MSVYLAPPREPTPRARQPHKIRYTSAEWAAVVDRARATGRPPARYVRDISLGHAPKGSHALSTAPAVHELGRIGTTLAGLLAIARETGALSEAGAVDAALTELLAAVRRVG